MPPEDYASGMENVQARIESTRRIGVLFRITALVLSLVSLIGAILHSVISYTPVFPIIVLVNSLICLIAGTWAYRLSRGDQQFADSADGLAYTAVVGGGIMVMFSVAAAISAIVGGTGGVAGPHGGAVLLNLSWPATVISLAALALGIRAHRRIKNLPR